MLTCWRCSCQIGHSSYLVICWRFMALTSRAADREQKCIGLTRASTDHYHHKRAQLLRYISVVCRRLRRDIACRQLLVCRYRIRGAMVQVPRCVPHHDMRVLKLSSHATRLVCRVHLDTCAAFVPHGSSSFNA